MDDVWFDDLEDDWIDDLEDDWIDDLYYYIQFVYPDPERVETYIKKGTNVNQHNSQDGLLPLHAAVMKHEVNFNVIELLLKNGASVSARNSLDGSCNALLYAVQNVNMTIQVIELLLKYKSNVNVSNPNDGFTVLQYACSNSNIDHSIIKLLLENGADVHAKNHLDGESTALLYAAQNENLQLEVIELLLNHGADIHAMNNNDGLCTAFLYAVKNPSVSGPVVQLLVDHGSDVHARNYKDQNANALWYALGNSMVNRDVVEIILKQKANVNTALYDMNVLKHALSNPSMTGVVIELMLQYSPDKLLEECSFTHLSKLSIRKSLLNYAMLKGKTSFEVVRVLLDRQCKGRRDYYRILREILTFCFLKSRNSRLACLEVLKYIVVERVSEEPLCICDFYTCQSVLGKKYYRVIARHVCKNHFAAFVRSCIDEILQMKKDGVFPILFPRTEVKELSLYETQKLYNRLIDMFFNDTYPLYIAMIRSNTKGKDVLNIFRKFKIHTYDERTRKTTFLDYESTLKIVECLSLIDTLHLIMSYYACLDDNCDSQLTYKATKKMRLAY